MTNPDRTAHPGATQEGAGLGGARVLVTRGGEPGERDAAEVARRGGVPVASPLTVIAPPEDTAPLLGAAAEWQRGAFDWVLITSANAAEAFAAACAETESSSAAASPDDARGSSRIAAVGPATADALRARGFDPALVPARDYSAVGLAAALLERLGDQPARVLFPVSEIADRTLEAALGDAGHSVSRVTAYRPVPAPRDEAVERSVAAGDIDAILVLSGSGAREVARRFAPVPPGTLLAAIGGPSARALADLGLVADVVADPHTVPSLLDGIAHAIATSPTTPGGASA